MPRLSMWMIRLSLAYLLAGFLLGGLLLAHKGISFWPAAWSILPAHEEFLLIGWLVQFALGVAFWILPRFAGGQRGDTRLAEASALLLNAGILLVAVQPLILPSSLFIPLGRSLELLAAASFALHAWPRIKPLFPGVR